MRATKLDSAVERSRILRQWYSYQDRDSALVGLAGERLQEKDSSYSPKTQPATSYPSTFSPVGNPTCNAETALSYCTIYESLEL